MLITSVNGTSVNEHPMARFLLDAGFQAAPLGFNVRRSLPPLPGQRVAVPPLKESGHA
jgi:ATP-dependent Lhr-like helicase